MGADNQQQFDVRAVARAVLAHGGRLSLTYQSEAHSSRASSQLVAGVEARDEITP